MRRQAGASKWPPEHLQKWSRRRPVRRARNIKPSERPKEKRVEPLTAIGVSASARAAALCAKTAALLDVLCSEGGTAAARMWHHHGSQPCPPRRIA